MPLYRTPHGDTLLKYEGLYPFLKPINGKRFPHFPNSFLLPLLNRLFKGFPKGEKRVAITRENDLWQLVTKSCGNSL